MDFEGVVGVPGSLGDGLPRALRLGKAGELIVLSRYRESVRRGRCFRAQTAVGGVAPGTAVGTTAAFSLANPLGSGLDLVLLELSMGYISGTLGAGVVLICGNIVTTGAIPTGTAIVPVNARIGDPQAPTGQAKTTATLAATPSILGPFCSLGASLATTALAPWQIVRDIAGGIVLAPGGVLSLQGVAAAGTSPLVVFGALWEEVAA